MTQEQPEPVRIDWHDIDSDWPYFWLLEMRGEWVKLQGRDDRTAVSTTGTCSGCAAVRSIS